MNFWATGALIAAGMLVIPAVTFYTTAHLLKGRRNLQWLTNLICYPMVIVFCLGGLFTFIVVGNLLFPNEPYYAPRACVIPYHSYTQVCGELQ